MAPFTPSVGAARYRWAVTTSHPHTVREDRRRETDQRRKVLGGVAAFLLVLALLAALTWTGVLPSPFTRDFSREATGTAAVEVACPPGGASPVPLTEISAHVLNGSGIEGQATRTAEGLTALGVTVTGTANWDGHSDLATLIITGEEGLVHAYTLRTVLPEAVVTSDGRSGQEVDVVLGEDSPLPLTPEAAPQLPQGEAFHAPADCV